MYADGHLNLYNTEGSDCFNGAAGTYTGGYRAATTAPASEALRKSLRAYVACSCAPTNGTAMAIAKQLVVWVFRT